MSSEQNSLYNFCNFIAIQKLFQNERFLLGGKSRRGIKYTYKIKREGRWVAEEFWKMKALELIFEAINIEEQNSRPKNVHGFIQVNHLS